MDKRRQSILKQDGRFPLQETVIPDFPEEDTATVTVTKSRRVSFGANFVKEFIVGSAVSAQFFSEYEQAVSSSDSSNPNSSRSGILDRSTFQCDDDDDDNDDALNLCVKPTNHDEFGPLKKKFCSEKLNSYSEINDRNNENIWDFNVNGSNIFTEKNTSNSNKSDMSRNNVKCNKKVTPLNDSSMNEKQFQNKRNESELNNSKMNETLEKKTKVGKFSSTIFFSADSPTADVEFTEGCISLAKSILDKKKKDMKVYIKGTPKDSRAECEREGSNTVVFESDDSDVEMKLTKCMDESGSISDLSTGNLSKYFQNPKGSEPIEEFDESHENIENVPIHMYSLNSMLNRGDNSQDSSELEKSIFFPERSLTEMLRSDPLKTTMTDVLSMDNDDMEECDMEISNSDMLATSIIDGNSPDGKDGPNIDSPKSSPPADDEDKECPSPIFSKVSVDGDLSLLSEDMTDPLKMSMCEDFLTGNGESDLELSKCLSLKVTECEKGLMKEEATMENPISAFSSSDEDSEDSSVKEGSEDHSLTEDADKRVSFSKTSNLGDTVVKEGSEDHSLTEDADKRVSFSKTFSLDNSAQKEEFEDCPLPGDADKRASFSKTSNLGDTVVKEGSEDHSLPDVDKRVSFSRTFNLDNSARKEEFEDCPLPEDADKRVSFSKTSNLEDSVRKEEFENCPLPGDADKRASFSKTSNLQDSVVKEGSEDRPLPEDADKRVSFLSTAKPEDCPPVDENKEITTALTMEESVRSSLLKEDSEEMVVSSTVEAFACEESSVDGEHPLIATDNSIPDSVHGNMEEETSKNEDSLPVSGEVNPGRNFSPEKEGSIKFYNMTEDSTVSRMEISVAGPAELSVSGQLLQCETSFSNFGNSKEETTAEGETGGMKIPQESAFHEDNEASAVFDTLKMSVSNDFPPMEEEKMDISMESAGEEEDIEMVPSRNRRTLKLFKCELNLSNENSVTVMKDDEEQNEKTCLQETGFGASTFLSQSSSEDDDRTSLGDMKILNQLKEQSEESNCCWTIESINHSEDSNFWCFSFPILKSSAVMKFKLRPPKNKSLVSFSAVLNGNLELRESNEYQLKKDKIGIDFAFGEFKKHFQRESHAVDNVHKMPLFLDKMNLIIRKVDGVLHQVIRILKDYPGSELKDSLLSFRVYSFPLLFSYLITVDVSDPFQLSEKSVSSKKHFGNLSLRVVKSIFKDCLGSDEVLIQFVRKLTEFVVGKERETGSVTKRSHIPLVR